MFAINVLNYADRWVGSVVAPLVQKQFHLNDFQVGLLGSAFTIVYALAEAGHLSTLPAGASPSAHAATTLAALCAAAVVAQFGAYFSVKR